MDLHTANGSTLLQNIDQWRELCEPMPTGISPATSSDKFKSPVQFHAIASIHFLSEESASRKGSTLKVAARYLKTPGIISLGGGLPSPEYFPIEKVRVDVSQPAGHQATANGSLATIEASKGDVRNGRGLYDLEVALNYGQAVGSAQLLRFVTEHTEIVHSPLYSDWQCCLTSGTTYAWDATLRMLCQRGDYILMEEYTFSSAQETALPQGLQIAPVPMDDDGLLPERLDEILCSWDVQARGARKPHVLYMVPTGQNPTGRTQPAARRRAIYAVAQRHDLCIIEDEPYYFLQMPTTTTGAEQESSSSELPSHESFLQSLIPSYLSLDVDGRVLRLDSFSKVLAPGLRVGWIVGAERLVERFTRGCETSNQNPSGVSQIIIYKLLDEQWGHAGYLDWLMQLQQSYRRRRDGMLQACDKYLPREIASWDAPVAGMFHWIRVDWTKHPAVKAGKTPEEIEEAVFHAAVDAGVLVCRGSWFRAGGASIGDNPLFFRTTFAAAGADAISQAISRLGQALRAEYQLDSSV
ncbi:aminotransferase-like domain-containing protein [Aspergillus brunneoviolaceus CBS 621.78]|uniref:Aromatic amino acid aminotransferase n=1 Tax=Aspergillus brunneoviolaceus CBS 621.78 TaxID=1450534 RepID=A0ACD1G0W8_9EURO|nr:aromatic amino acid aminotransferase [Aspergillus brunneoviolaceus CBS 621.78]RAH42911.1 aromatic amino acid aminotransferase [Aspergillus brunneoviolaceus CBS 621.78]